MGARALVHVAAPKKGKRLSSGEDEDFDVQVCDELTNEEVMAAMRTRCAVSHFTPRAKPEENTNAHKIAASLFRNR